MRKSLLLKPTFTCLPNWLRGKVTPAEGWLLWVLKSHHPNIYPSIETLAEESGMSQRTVTGVLKKLEYRGLIQKQNPFQAGSKRRSNTYELLVDEAPGEAFLAAEQAGNGATSLAKSAGVPWQNLPTELGKICGGTLAKFANKEEQPKNYKIKNLKLMTDFLEQELLQEEPPLVPPSGGSHVFSSFGCDERVESKNQTSTSEPVENLQAPPSAEVTEGKSPGSCGEAMGAVEMLDDTSSPVAVGTGVEQPRMQAKRRVKFAACPEIIPTELQALTPEILEFWRAKGGKKSERAWMLMLGGVREIWRESDEDTARYQLELGAKKGWQGIDYDRWVQFGRQRRPQAPSHGDQRPWERHNLRGEQNVRAALALLRARKAAQSGPLVPPHQEPRSAALQGHAGASGEVVNVEVMA